MFVRYTFSTKSVLKFPKERILTTLWLLSIGDIAHPLAQKFFRFHCQDGVTCSLTITLRLMLLEQKLFCRCALLFLFFSATDSFVSVCLEYSQYARTSHFAIACPKWMRNLRHGRFDLKPQVSMNQRRDFRSQTMVFASHFPNLKSTPWLHQPGLRCAHTSIGETSASVSPPAGRDLGPPSRRANLPPKLHSFSQLGALVAALRPFAAEAACGELDGGSAAIAMNHLARVLSPYT